MYPLTLNNTFEFDNEASSDNTDTRKITESHINHIRLPRICQTKPLNHPCALNRTTKSNYTYLRKTKLLRNAFDDKAACSQSKARSKRHKNNNKEAYHQLALTAPCCWRRGWLLLRHPSPSPPALRRGEARGGERRLPPWPCPSFLGKLRQRRRGGIGSIG
jgi:hypothetical protein